MKSVLRVLKDLRLWALVAGFASCALLHYHRQVAVWWGRSLLSFMPTGLAAQTTCLSRVLVLGPIIYATTVYGSKGGLFSVAAATVLLLPGIFESPSPAAATVEVLTVTAVAAFCIWWFSLRSREIGKQERALAEMTAAEEQIHGYADQIGHAHEEERKRIARELHDDTVQTLVAISRDLELLVDHDPPLPEAIQDELSRLQAETHGALGRMRDFVQDLRPPTLEHLGLLPALRELVRQTSSHSGVEIRLDVAGDEFRLSKDNSLLIYRIIQEALRNVCKHSRAATAELRVRYQPDMVTLVVRDEGRGFRREKTSTLLDTKKLGLMGMKERARLLGGTLDIISAPDEGTVVALVVPKPQPVQDVTVTT